jgi:hypothetical protein
MLRTAMQILVCTHMHPKIEDGIGQCDSSELCGTAAHSAVVHVLGCCVPSQCALSRAIVTVRFRAATMRQQAAR